MMARKKKVAPVLSITGAAQLLNLHPWQVARIAKHLIPEPPRPGYDRRCKWFQRDLLLSAIQRERNTALPLAS